MKNHNKAFGKVLRSFRKARGYTQETLAFEAGIDRTYVSLLELGARSPTLDTIFALCAALGVSFPELSLRIHMEMNGGTAHG